MIHATYKYYRESFGGDIVPEEYFARCANLAGRYIDRFTFRRITEENRDGFPSIKDCACEMAETVYELRFKDGGKAVKSENTDGYSVSYVTERQDGEDVGTVLEKKLYGICRLYLMDTGLMYRGVS